MNLSGNITIGGYGPAVIQRAISCDGFNGGNVPLQQVAPLVAKNGQMLGCGVSTLRFCPPLVVSKEQCDVAVGILMKPNGDVLLGLFPTVAQGRIDHVFAGETRPWLQGARLTVWELQQDGIPVTLIADRPAGNRP